MEEGDRLGFDGYSTDVLREVHQETGSSAYAVDSVTGSHAGRFNSKQPPSSQKNIEIYLYLHSYSYYGRPQCFRVLVLRPVSYRLPRR